MIVFAVGVAGHWVAERTQPGVAMAWLSGSSRLSNPPPPFLHVGRSRFVVRAAAMHVRSRLSRARATTIDAGSSTRG